MTVPGTGKGAPDWDYRGPWYHGSQQPLTVLRTGSAITRNGDLARAFAHQPSLLSLSADGSVKHDGTTPGYLYLVAEEVKPEDVFPHPHPAKAARWEWLTHRGMRVLLVKQTQVRDRDRLSAEEIAALRRKQQEKGAESFAE
jgi:hypothetical protein